MKNISLSNILTFITLMSTFTAALPQDPGNPENLAAGYNKYIAGENFNYHSLRPDVSEAMLVRSMGKELYIEWESEPVPVDFRKKEMTFIMMVNINVRKDDPHSWDILVDGNQEFSISTPSTADLTPLNLTGREGLRLKFNPVSVDKYGDLMGYLYITIPAERVTPGKPVRFRMVGESANSRAFFIVYKYTMKPGLNIIPEQAVRIEGNSSYQQVRVIYNYMGSPGRARIEAGGVITDTFLQFGYNTVIAKIPAVKEDTPFTVSLKMGKTKLAEGNYMVSPVIPRTVHLLHHSHVDIGYTHIQDEVEKIQWTHLENAIRLSEESANNPPGARFRWNAEVMWPVQSYLENHPGEKGDALREAIKRGDIEIGSTFAHMLSELCNSEELIQVAHDARRFAAETGVKNEAAMITDVPGWSWGMVPVLAGSGVKYLSLGTNHGHRIGTIMEEWGDRPFWWVSPSGEEKVLCWIHLNGYSMFHTGASDNRMSVDLFSEQIFNYLNQLYDRNYQYEIVPARYSIGADNGPVDPDLTNMVLQWNSMFETPKLKISTVTETFSEFEARYGDKIPAVRGAFTGYWEDGAASSSLMTGLNRQAAGNVNIASSLAVITGFGEDITGDLRRLWKNVMLYNEHTWGSWNSISDPEDEFTLSQWAVKSSFARVAALEGIKLRDRILGIDPGWRSNILMAEQTTDRVEVINTHSWEVTQPVEIPGTWNPAGHVVRDESGTIVPSQLLSTGNLCFVAEKVPAAASRIYYLSGSKMAPVNININDSQISNTSFTVKADKTTGAITSLYSKKLKRELVDNSMLPGINSAWYVEGRSPVNRSSTYNGRVRITDQGKLVSVIETESELRGCNRVISRYTIVEGLERIYVTTIIDKKKIYNQEGLHIAFPFNISDPEINIDLALGVYRPEYDQPGGACKNYFTAEHWIDVSGRDYGITLTSLDAPLFEIGDITTDATAYGWLKNIRPSSSVWSYVMNNYWETNYLAGQEGEIPFRYIISPHGPFNAGWSERTAMAEAERLVVVPGSLGKKGLSSLFTMGDDNIIVTAMIPAQGGYLLRLFNAGGSPSAIDINWKKEPAEVWFTGFEGERLNRYTSGTIIPAWGVATLRVYN